MVLIRTLLSWSEEFKKARAAHQLANMGYYKEAKALMLGETA
jgi:hypothetical protein